MNYRIVLDSPEAMSNPPNAWSNPSFMTAVATMQNLEPYHLKCLKGKELVALLPVYEKNTLGYRRLVCPAGSYYQGLNLWLEQSSSAPRKLLDVLQITLSMAEYLKQKYKKIQFNLSPETYDIRGFSWAGFKAVPLYTFVCNPTLELKPLSDERKKIALALKQNYEFIEETAVEQFIKLSQSMNERKSRHLGFSYSKFNQFVALMLKQGLMRQFNLKQQGEIVSSNILIQDGAKAYTVFRATAPEALKLGASSLHTVKLVESMKADGVTELDFCGGNVPEVARFKAAQGLTLKVFYQIKS